MMNNNLHSSQFTPPEVLVKTWCLLARDKDHEISSHAIQMLLDTYGDMRGLVEFVKVHHIRVGIERKAQSY